MFTANQNNINFDNKDIVRKNNSISENVNFTINEDSNSLGNTHTNNEHTNNEHTNNEHTNNEHTNNEHTNNEHTNNEHTNNEHMDNAYTNNEYTNNEHMNNEYTNNEHYKQSKDKTLSNTNNYKEYFYKSDMENKSFYDNTKVEEDDYDEKVYLYDRNTNTNSKKTVGKGGNKGVGFGDVDRGRKMEENLAENVVKRVSDNDDIRNVDNNEEESRRKYNSYEEFENEDTVDSGSYDNGSGSNRKTNFVDNTSNKNVDDVGRGGKKIVDDEINDVDNDSSDNESNNGFSKYRDVDMKSAGDNNQKMIDNGNGDEEGIKKDVDNNSEVLLIDANMTDKLSKANDHVNGKIRDKQGDDDHNDAYNDNENIRKKQEKTKKNEFLWIDPNVSKDHGEIKHEQNSVNKGEILMINSKMNENIDHDNLISRKDVTTKFHRLKHVANANHMRNPLHKTTDTKHKTMLEHLDKYGRPDYDESNTKKRISENNDIEDVPVKGDVIEYFHHSDKDDEDIGVMGRRNDYTIPSNNRYIKPDLNDDKAMDYNVMSEYLDSIHKDIHKINDPATLKNYSMQNAKFQSQLNHVSHDNIDKTNEGSQRGHYYYRNNARDYAYEEIDKSNKIILNQLDLDNRNGDEKLNNDLEALKGRRKHLNTNKLTKRHNYRHPDTHKYSRNDKGNSLFEETPDITNGKPHTKYVNAADALTDRIHQIHNMHNLYFTNLHPRVRPGEDRRKDADEMLTEKIHQIYNMDNHHQSFANLHSSVHPRVHPGEDRRKDADERLSDRIHQVHNMGKHHLYFTNIHPGVHPGEDSQDDADDDTLSDRVHQIQNMGKHHLYFTNLHRRVHPGEDSRNGNWEVFKNLYNEMKNKHPEEKQHDNIVGDSHDDITDPLSEEERDNDEGYHHKKNDRETRLHEKAHANNKIFEGEEDHPRDKNSMEKEHKKNRHDDNGNSESDNVEPFNDNSIFSNAGPKIGFSFNKNFNDEINDGDNDNDDSDSGGDGDGDGDTANAGHGLRGYTHNINGKDDKDYAPHNKAHKFNDKYDKDHDLREIADQINDKNEMGQEVRDFAHKSYDKSKLRYGSRSLPYNLSDKYVMGHESRGTAYNGSHKINEVYKPQPHRLDKNDYNHLPLGYYGPVEEDINPQTETNDKDMKSIYLYGKGVVDIQGKNGNSNNMVSNTLPTDDHPAHYLFRKLAENGNMENANYEHSLDDHINHHAMQDISLSNDLSNLPGESSLHNNPVIPDNTVSNDLPNTLNSNSLKNPQSFHDISVNNDLPNSLDGNVLSNHRLLKDNFVNHGLSNLPDDNSLPNSLPSHCRLLQGNAPNNDLSNSLNGNSLPNHRPLQDNSLSNSLSGHSGSNPHLLRDNSMNNDFSNTENSPSLNNQNNLLNSDLPNSLNSSSLDNHSIEQNPFSKNELSVVNPLDYEIPRFPQRTNSDGVNEFFDHEIQRISQHVNELPLVADKQSIHPSVLEDLLATFVNFSKLESVGNINKNTSSTTTQRVTLENPDITPEIPEIKNIAKPLYNIPILQNAEHQIPPFNGEGLTTTLNPKPPLIDPNPWDASQYQMPTSQGLSKNALTIQLNPEPPLPLTLGLSPYQRPTAEGSPFVNTPDSIQPNSIPSMNTESSEPSPNECKSYQALTSEGLSAKEKTIPLNPKPPLPPKYGLSPYQVLTTEGSPCIKTPEESIQTNPISSMVTVPLGPSPEEYNSYQLFKAESSGGKDTPHPQIPLPPKSAFSPPRIMQPNTFSPMVNVPPEPSPNECKSYQALTSEGLSEKEKTIPLNPKPPLPPKYGLSPYQVLTTEGSPCIKTPESIQSNLIPPMNKEAFLNDTPFPFSTQYFLYHKPFTMQPDLIPSTNTQSSEPSCEACNSYQTSEGLGEKDAPIPLNPKPPLPPEYGLSSNGTLTTKGSPCKSPSGSMQSNLTPPMDNEAFLNACKSYEKLASEGCKSSNQEQWHSSQTTHISPRPQYFLYHKPFIMQPNLIPSTNTQSSEPSSEACKSYQILTSEGLGEKNTPIPLNPKPPLPPEHGLSSYETLTTEGSPCKSPSGSMQHNLTPPMDNEAFLNACKSYEKLASEGCKSSNQEQWHSPQTTHISPRPQYFLYHKPFIMQPNLIPSTNTQSSEPSSEACKSYQILTSEGLGEKNTPIPLNPKPPLPPEYGLSSYETLTTEGSPCKSPSGSMQHNLTPPMDNEAFLNACKSYEKLASEGCKSSNQEQWHSPQTTHISPRPQYFLYHKPFIMQPNLIPSTNTQSSEPSSEACKSYQILTSEGLGEKNTPIPLNPKPPPSRVWVIFL